jgi:hypothetical protein
MNADFEAELAHEATRPGKPYHPTSFMQALNRRLAPRLLWLADEGDALLLDERPPDALREEAARRGVRLLMMGEGVSGEMLFAPWGWTRRACEAGARAGATLMAPPLEVVARVNSKLWSHALEVEQGFALPGAGVAATFEELEQLIESACPDAEKWVVKSAWGFAARERVLGRGPRLEEPQARWARKQFARGQSLIFQPWLEVVREYGVVMEISREGAVEVLGFSDVLTNGAGTATGYTLGRPPTPQRAAQLRQVAHVVGRHLHREGYFGPAGFDAIEHAGGLHPLLEINARFTMGFVALAVERELKPRTPTVWNTTAASERREKA